MVLQLFQALFGAALFGLVLSVPAGLALLAWPRRIGAAQVATPHAASAHA